MVHSFPISPGMKSRMLGCDRPLTVHTTDLSELRLLSHMAWTWIFNSFISLLCDMGQITSPLCALVSFFIMCVCVGDNGDNAFRYIMMIERVTSLKAISIVSGI